MGVFEFNNLIKETFLRVLNSDQIEPCEYVDFYMEVRKIVVAQDSRVQDVKSENFDRFFDQLYEETIRQQCFEGLLR